MHVVVAGDSDRHDRPPGVVVQRAEVVIDQELTLPANADDVISALGKRSNRDPAPVCAAGAANLVDAVRRHGVQRLVAATTDPSVIGRSHGLRRGRIPQRMTVWVAT